MLKNTQKIAATNMAKLAQCCGRLFGPGIICLFCWMVALYPYLMAVEWLPYLRQGWSEGICTVRQGEIYRLKLEEGDGYEVDYASMHVQVNISGILVTGFTCATPDARSGSGTKYPGVSWDYLPCPDQDVCGKLLLLPRWTCLACHSCEEYFAIPQACLWRLVQPDGVSMRKPREWPASYSAPFPMPGTAFVHVIIGESIYYPLGDFIALQVVGFLGICVCPVLFCICVLVDIKERRQQRQPPPPLLVPPRLPAAPALTG
jgi:hypothetical protein